MDSKDQKLGMNRPISRRDVIHGIGTITAGAIAAKTTASPFTSDEKNRAASNLATAMPSGGYPPAYTGMRGNHPGSFEVAHQLARAGQNAWGNVSHSDSQLYDLVVVGGGISGLSAAHFYQKQNPDARILILDNHDDFGGHASTSGPDKPVIATMFRYPHTNNQGLTAKEQYRRARHELLSTTFETIERNVRIQLVSMLGSAGFDPARGILGITVNRWAHGYAYDMSSHALFDQVYEDTEDVRYLHMQARKRFGRITIANADSAASAMLEAAVEQGYRAITELPV